MCAHNHGWKTFYVENNTVIPSQLDLSNSPKALIKCDYSFSYRICRLTLNGLMISMRMEIQKSVD